MEKTCTRCQTAKDLGAFPLEKAKSKHHPWCKECHRAFQRERRANKDILRRDLDQQKEYRQRRRGHRRKNDNDDRARGINRMPAWLTPDHHQQMKDIYELAHDCTIMTGEVHTVDHIVPLCGFNVSGLHVPWNLQVLPADLNWSKARRHFGPDAWTPEELQL